MTAIAARAAAMPALARGAVCVLIADLAFASMDALAKGLMTRHDPLQVVWARYAMQALLVTLLFAPRLRTVLRTQKLGMQVLRSAFMFGATVSGFFAFSLLPLAEATAIFQVAPLMITALAALLLAEPVGPRRWAGVAAGFVGAMIIVRPGAAAFQPAALLPLLCALCFAGYSVSTRFLGRTEDWRTTFLYTAGLGAVLATLWLPLVWTTPTPSDAALMVLLGLLGAAGQLMFIFAYTLAPASAVAPLTYVGLVFAGLFGWTFFDDIPDGFTLAGAAVIVGSGLYVWRRERLGSAP
ncbi:MAG: DMT family transporter [Rhodobacteraceae bacterium]|nr:MAG: DMT family transporter [Paracoccaceae bacterium]